MGDKLKKAIIIIESVLFFLTCIISIQLYLRIQESNRIIEEQSYLRQMDVERYAYSWNDSLRYLNLSPEIVFMGDSITIHHDFQSDFPEKTILNLGCAGDTTYNLLDRCDIIEDMKPKRLFLMVGVNDLMQGNINSCLDNYNQLLDKLSDINPDCMIYVQNVLPVRNDAVVQGYAPDNKIIDEFNTKLEHMCEKRGCYVDLNPLFKINGELCLEYTTDGLHLSDKGYDVWTSHIEKMILDE